MRLPLPLLVTFFTCMTSVVQGNNVARKKGPLTLDEDGTWVEVYQRPPSAKAKKTFECGGFSLFYDPRVWVHKGKDVNDVSIFTDHSGELEAVILYDSSSSTFAEISSLVAGAFKAGLNDPVETYKEKRIVNNLEVFALGLLEKVKEKTFRISSYMSSSKTCTIIVSVVSPERLTQRQERRILNFLNGLIVE